MFPGWLRLTAFTALAVSTLLAGSAVGPASATLTLNLGGNNSRTFPTYNYFEASRVSFDVTGLLLHPGFDTSGDCRLSLTSRVFQTAQQQNGAGCVLSLEWSRAKAAGCVTISHAARAVEEFATKANVPNSVFLLQLTRLVSGFSGGPETEAYTSDRPSIPDSVPTIDTALVPSSERLAILRLFNSTDGSITARVVSTPGPWNDIFLHWAYTAFTIVLIVTNAVFLIYSLYIFFCAYREGLLTYGHRDRIFVAGVISTILTLSHIYMSKTTLVRVILSQFTALISSLAFYALLLLWSGIIMANDKNATLVLLRIPVYIAMVLQFLAFVFQLVQAAIQEPGWYKVIMEVIFWVMPSMQILISIMFIYYAYTFARRRREWLVSKQTVNALRLLGYLALTGVFSYLVAVAANLINAVKSLEGDPMAWAIQYQLQHVWRTARNISILLVLSISIPRYTANDKGKTHLGSNPTQA